MSEQTSALPAWQRVVAALEPGRESRRFVYRQSPAEVLDGLRREFPRYVCFVAQPEEVTRAFVRNVHQTMRGMDDDPYPDAFWGILTGYDAKNALRIASCRDPLTIGKSAAGTEIALELCKEGLWYCELKQGRMVRKRIGGQPTEETAPPDTTQALANALTEYQADLFVTSGHATERDWQIGFGYKNGTFRCQDGVLYGLDTQGRKFPIHSPNPKVFMPVGNCLMGHIDSREAMALAYMNSGGVNQMLGYIEPTWYGYAGWGVLDYFVEQPGRYSFTEAFFANQIALIQRLDQYFPDLTGVTAEAANRSRTRILVSPAAQEAGLSGMDGRGLLFDRDNVAFYGDPAWRARMAAQPLHWEQKLTRNGNVYSFEITPNRGDRSFAAINTNGSQRGGRPLVQFLPNRIENPQIVQGAELRPVITDNFILVPRPTPGQPAETYRVVFTADQI